MDNMPDFDSMTPEEMMAWMEALAKRQGATEGLFTSADVEVPEIDPSTVNIDEHEPGYIPFGMDPEVWAQKKAKEDTDRAARIAAMKADQDKTTPIKPAIEAAAPVEEPAATANPLDFLADLSGAPAPEIEIEPEIPTAFAAPVEDFAAPPVIDDTPLEDLFADLGGAVTQDSGGMDWLADLGQSSGGVPDLDNLDFGSLDMLDEPEPQGDSNPLDWLESLVGSEEAQAQPEASGEMFLENNDITEDSAVSSVLNDPMEWLNDFAETQPMDELAAQAASHDVLSVSDDLDSFFDRIGSTEDSSEIELDLNSPMGELADSGMIDFGGTPDFDADESEVGVGSALTQGSEVPAEDVKAWMDSLLDRGIQRTDVTDDYDEDGLEADIKADLPDWLVEQVGEPPSEAELLAAGEGDLPDWLTAPVSDTQNAEFEEMFNQMAEDAVEEASDQLAALLPELDDQPVAPLDTGVIRVQMNDPWVEAFELERDERLSDTGRLAAWYESAAHEVDAAQRHGEEAAEIAASAPEPAASFSSLRAAQLPADEELPPGESQSIPTWLGGEEPAAVAPIATDAAADGLQHAADEDLPDWLRAAQLESDEMAEVPSWLTDSLSTDEFEILQLGGTNAEKSDPAPAASIQDEPTAQVQVQPKPAVQPAPISQRPTSELPRVARPSREPVAPHEVAGIINQARASQRMGDIGATLNAYDRLIRSEAALDEIETDMEKLAKDAVQKTNPSVLRVYGDVLLRQGKLQQALDTYRAALNLL